MAGGGSRRQAILEAMVHVAGSKGYVATSVADVLERAGASRTTFYRNFADKQTCFLAAYEMAAERVFSEVVAGCNTKRPWLERVRGGLATITELLFGELELGRTVVVEVAATGGAGRRLHGATLARFAALLDAGSEPTAGATPPANAGLMGVSAAAGLIFDELQQGERPASVELLPELVFAALLPYVGPREAAAEMRRGTANPPSR